MRQLIARGQLISWLQPIPHRPRVLVVRKVDRWVCDGDGGAFAEQEQAADALQLLTDAAWETFRAGCGYAMQIAEVAALLARQEQRDPGAVNPGDRDLAR
jgi:hypothetical protein